MPRPPHPGTFPATRTIMTSGATVEAMSAITTAPNAGRMAQWQAAADALAAARTHDEVMVAVLKQVAPVLGARAAWVAVEESARGAALRVASAADGPMVFDIIRPAA